MALLQLHHDYDGTMERQQEFHIILFQIILFLIYF